MSRRKGTPCACNTDPCSCGSSRNCVRAVNNVSPDPNGDLIIRGGQGIEVIQSGDDLIINNTANPNAFVAGDNIEMSLSGDDIEIALTQDPVINGTLTVNGDIIQNGASYETHAEKIYTRDDYIIMREGAIAALAPGDYAGFQVKLYDGVNDGRLVIDNSGTARVGDVGNEQPLLTRDESADLTDGDLLQWNGTDYKAVDAGKKISDLVEGSGNIGSDTKPIKIVNGVATAITKDVITVDGGHLNRNKQIIFDVDPYNSGIRINTSSSDGSNIQIMNVYNNQSQSLMGLYLSYDSANGVRLNASLRKADGSYRYVVII